MDDVELMRFVGRAPLRAVRWEDIDERVSNAGRTLARLVRKGALTRIARGVYVAPPNGADGRTWKAPLEAAGLALATVRFGQRQVVLTGLSAARFWQAFPRALGVVTLAVPARGRHPVVLDTGAVVKFVYRDAGRLDATLERTPLGEALVTSPAQTLFDLLSGRGARAMTVDIEEAVQNLIVRVTGEELAAVADRTQRVPQAVKSLLRTFGEKTDAG